MTAPTDHAPSAPLGPVDLVPRPEAGEAPAEVPEPAPRRDGRRYRGRYARTSWWWRWGFSTTLAVALVAVPVLVYTGTRVVLGSTDGRVIQAITDPSAPGWQAAVEPTPVQGIALLDPQGALDSVAVLVDTNEGHGTVVVVPGATLVDVPDVGRVPLSTLLTSGGTEGVRNGLEQVLGVGVPTLDAVGAARWADLVAPVGPLTIDNPDNVTGGGTAQARYPRGTVTVPPAQVWDYLSARGTNENQLNRLGRQEAFWKAWLAAVGRHGDQVGVVPGELDVGLGKAVRALGGARLDVVTLPVKAEALPGGTTAYAPVADQVAALVARAVPLPAGPEGTRVHLVVLDGTGELDHGVAAAVTLAVAGGQVDKVGNAEELGVPTTRFVYSDGALTPQVEALRAALGVGVLELRESQGGGPPGVTVILGEDYLTRVAQGGNGGQGG